MIIRVQAEMKEHHSQLITSQVSIGKMAGLYIYDPHEDTTTFIVLPTPPSLPLSHPCPSLCVNIKYFTRGRRAEMRPLQYV